MSKIIIEPICSDLVLKSAHSVLAKKFINQTVDIIRPVEAGLVLVSKKTEKTICSDFVFSIVTSADFQENFKTNL